MSWYWWYAISVVGAWAAHIVWDATESRSGKLSPAVVYVAFALIWPLPMSIIVLAAIARRFARPTGTR